MIQAGPRQIGDGIVRLREVTREDAGRLYQWRMDPTTLHMFRNKGSVAYEAHLAYLERYFQPENDDQWFIVEDAGGPVGALALYDFAGDGSAEWGRMVIDPSARGRGYARRSLKLLIAHARALGLTGLRCNVGAHNAVARHLYRSEGFVDVGVEHIDERCFVHLILPLAEE